MLDSIVVNYNDIQLILEERSELEFLFDVHLGTLRDITEFLKFLNKQVKNFPQMTHPHFI